MDSDVTISIIRLFMNPFPYYSMKSLRLGNKIRLDSDPFSYDSMNVNRFFAIVTHEASRI